MAAVFVVAACRPVGTVCVFPPYGDLRREGMVVAHNLGCEEGCERIEEGDVIVSIDGTPVENAEAFDAIDLTDGQPHRLQLFERRGDSSKTVELVALPGDPMPPLATTPPLWTVSAADLNQAPDWARRRLFGHASPRVRFVGIHGDVLDGRRLYGRKRLIVYWERHTEEEEAIAVTFMQVLHKAHADLQAKDVDVMFVWAPFRAADERAPSDADLVAFRDRWALPAGEAPQAPVPMYRMLDGAELGLEPELTVRDSIAVSPAIVVLDERGIVRWHSEGTMQSPEGSIIDDARQYPIIEAVVFALEKP